jgi:hypothetical protein
MGDNYDFVMEEFDLLENEADILVIEANAAMSALTPLTTMAITLVPKNVQSLTHLVAPYESHLQHAQMLTDIALSQLRHLEDVTVPQDIENEVNEESQLVRRLSNEALAYLTKPYPSQPLLHILQKAEKAVAERVILSVRTYDTSLAEVSAWEDRAVRLERSTREKVSSAEEAGGIPPQLLESIFGRAEDIILRRLKLTLEKFVEIVEAWRRLRDDSSRVSTDLAAILQDALKRDDTFAAMRKSSKEALVEADVQVNIANQALKHEIARLRALSLDQKTQLPLADKGLRPIVEIFRIKPPKIITETCRVTTQNAKKWYNRNLAAVLHLPAEIQVMHYFHPFQKIMPHVIVIGDNCGSAVRIAAMVASTHLRAPRKVTVYISSEGMRQILRDVVHRQRFDVNLQQLYTGMGRTPNPDGKDASRIHAQYEIKVVTEGQRADAPVGENCTCLYLLLTPGSLPSLDSQKMQGMALTLLPHVAPHNSQFEAERTLGVSASQSRAKLAQLLSGKVFQISDEVLRKPAITKMNIPIAVIRGKPTTLMNLEAAITVGLPFDIRKARLFSTDRELRAHAPAAVDMLHAVMEADRRHSDQRDFLQVIYMGGDAHSSDKDLVRMVVRMLQERFGYTNTDKPGSDLHEARPVGSCSSLQEWKRLMNLPHPPVILVCPRIIDPAFAMTVRGRVGILHAYTPSSNSTECRRVERQFVPASIIKYVWPKNVLRAKKAFYYPGYGAAKALQELALEVSINRTAILKDQYRTRVRTNSSDVAKSFIAKNA